MTNVVVNTIKNKNHNSFRRIAVLRCDPGRTRTPTIGTGILRSIQLNYGTILRSKYRIFYAFVKPAMTKEDQLIEGTQLSTMAELTDLVVDSDKVITF
ncbi:MAG: hypothetical protein JG782_540 [Anaerophaga sp.]|nr:hypothetical protein [Anaerophaga sp.]MDI3520850.1 hypothetical protein [Anaerophaga sp.]MDK2841271.1 hypothetical protein [Anaerophaga sp.]